VKGNGDTIVRGGAGVFYVREMGNNQYSIINVAPNSFQMTLDAYNLPMGSLGYDQIGNQNPFQALTPGNFSTPNANDLAWPRAYNGSISIAQRLPGKNTLEIGYVGTFQRHNVMTQEQNNVAPGGLNAYSAEMKQQYPEYSEPLLRAAINDAAYNKYRNFPTLGGIELPVYVGESNYHSLQATLSRQTGSFTYLLAYTLSQAKGHVGDDTYTNLDPTVIPNWQDRSWGILRTDRTHIFNASWSWRLGAPVKEGALKYLVNDWNLSGISTYSSGQPFRPFFDGSNLGSDAMEAAWYGTHSYANGGADAGVPGPITPTYSCDPNIGGSPAAGEKIWDINCIGIPAFGETGPTYPPNTLRLPGKSFHDLTVFKDFALGGSRRLQLRLGVFNIFNQAYADTVSFSDIDTTLKTTCTQVAHVPNGIGGDSGSPGTCDPLLPFAFDDTTKNNFGNIRTKRGHRTVEFAVRLFF
jgi:hypothetical protein